jgi:hypothetical protein
MKKRNSIWHHSMAKSAENNGNSEKPLAAAARKSVAKRISVICGIKNNIARAINVKASSVIYVNGGGEK